jgi:hypothetical protein
MKYSSPSFQVKKLLIVANKKGYNLCTCCDYYFSKHVFVFNLIAMGAKSKEINILERFVEIIPRGFV